MFPLPSNEKGLSSWFFACLDLFSCFLSLMVVEAGCGNRLCSFLIFSRVSALFFYADLSERLSMGLTACTVR